MIKITLAILVTLAVNAVAADVEWTRFKGTVISKNLTAKTLSLTNDDKDLFIFPIDYQVQIVDKKNVIHELKDTELGSKVTLIRIISEKPKDDTDGLVPYHGVDSTAGVGEQEPVKRKK